MSSASDCPQRLSAYLTEEQMQTRRRSQRSEPKSSILKDSATSLGDMVETAAGVLGRGMAAAVRGAGDVADRAAEITGLSTKADAPPASPPAAVRAASRATERVSRTAATSAPRTTR